MAVQTNATTAVSIASTRVGTWVLDQDNAGSGDRYTMWHGLVTSTGSESVVVTLATGTQTMGSACGEYTSAFNTTVNGPPASGSTFVRSQVGSDVVVFASNSIGTVSITTPYTQRQGLLLGGIQFAAFGDVNAGSTANWTPSVSTTSGTVVMMDGLCTGGCLLRIRHETQVTRLMLPPPLFSSKATTVATLFKVNKSSAN